MSHKQKRKSQVRHEVCDQTRQKENLLPCPAPYVTEVMFYDIHPDSDTHQLEVPSPLSPVHPSGIQPPGRERKQDGRESTVTRNPHFVFFFYFYDQIPGLGWMGCMENVS